MKPKVNKETCIGCGLCVSIAPESFKLDENLKAEATGAVPDEQKAREAKDCCPVTAIELEQ